VLKRTTVKIGINPPTATYSIARDSLAEAVRYLTVIAAAVLANSCTPNSRAVTTATLAI
jgi:hypothetical protein